MKKYVIIAILVLGLGFGLAYFFGFIPGTKRNLVSKILSNHASDPAFKETKDTLMAKTSTDLQKMIDDDMKNTFPTI